jgi:Trypsin-co-occurring domain 1
MLVELQADGSVLYVEARELAPLPGDDEQELSGSVRRLPAATVDHVVAAVGGFASQIGASLAQSGCQRYSVEFGCEIAVETGRVVAVLGKGSATSSVKITLEWDQAGQ